MDGGDQVLLSHTALVFLCVVSGYTTCAEPMNVNMKVVGALVNHLLRAKDVMLLSGRKGALQRQTQ